MTEFTQKTNFYFLGKRYYIQGVVIFAEFWQTLINNLSSKELPHGVTSITQIKFNQIIINDGSVVVEVLGEDTDKKMTDRAAAEMTCILPDKKTVKVGLFLDANHKVIRRYDKDPHPINLINFRYKDSFCGDATLINPLGEIDLVKAIVALNKRLHQSTLGCAANGYNIEWLYLRNFDTVIPTKYPQRLQIDIKHLRSMPQGSSLLTLNQARYKISGRTYSPTICYLLKKKTA